MGIQKYVNSGKLEFDEFGFGQQEYWKMGFRKSGFGENGNRAKYFRKTVD